MLPAVKSSITTLLEEYLETSWFINDKRKIATQILITAVKEATDFNAVIALVQQSKIEVGESDIKENQHSFWRRVKPLHSKGRSRFQETLDKALALSKALSPENKESENVEEGLIKELNRQHHSLLKGQSADDSPIPTFDSFKAAEGALKPGDKYNAKVITKSLEQALKAKEGAKGPLGMTGRFTQFKPAEEKEEPAKSSKDLGLDI